MRGIGRMCRPFILQFFLTLMKNNIKSSPVLKFPLLRKLTQVDAMASVPESTTSRERTGLLHLEVL